MSPPEKAACLALARFMAGKIHLSLSIDGIKAELESRNDRIGPKGRGFLSPDKLEEVAKQIDRINARSRESLRSVNLFF